MYAFTVTKVCSFSVVVILALVAFSGHAMASITSEVPEINPSSITTGLGLLAAGILIVRSRRRSK